MVEITQAGSGICARLAGAGLRPTRQRIALAKILFCRGNRHLTVEDVYAEAHQDRIPVSLATVYNTLHQFTELGLLREISVSGGKTFFDADTSEHPHFFIEDDQSIRDITPAMMNVERVPEPPPGFEVDRVEIVVRLRRVT
ncbi:transcriptional repressor [Mesorhizobium sp. B3-1-6]|nr:transcriptional repressor [Mesorhizobium sp. B3-1-6]